MPLNIRKIQVWSGEIPDLVGAAAAKLEHLNRADVDLQFVFTRPHPRNPDMGLIFLAPIVGSEQIKAAYGVGLAPALDAAMLYIQGPNQPGMGYMLMSELAVARIPLQGLSISAAEGYFGAYLAFNNPDDASQAIQVLAMLDVE
jgi:hypothetical protein